MLKKCGFACLVILFLQSSLFADGWDSVMKQRKGKTLFILLKSGRWLVAEMNLAEKEKLLVENGAGRYEAFWRNEIQEIRIKNGSIGKSILIGTLVAAGSVLVTGLLAESKYTGDDKYMLTGIATMYAAPVGASLGLLHGVVNKSKDLLYRAEPEDEPADTLVFPEAPRKVIRCGYGDVL